MTKRPAHTQTPGEMNERSVPWPFPDGRPPSWGKNDRVSGAISEANLQGDGLRHPICQFLKAQEESRSKFGWGRPTVGENMDAYLDAHYGDRVPTFDEYRRDQKALTLLAKERGLADSQYLRKPYAAAVRARNGGELPREMTPNAIRKRAEREAKKAGDKAAKTQGNPLVKDAHGALAKSLQDAFPRLPAAFEKLSLYVLSVEYGVRPEDAKHTGRPGDGGIDGFIDRRRLGLGLDNIYVQATLSAVGHSKVRAFHRGLTYEPDPKRGVLVTASRVGRKAKASANSVGIRVIDGMELAQIMIDLELGVSAKKGAPRIDHDFFSVEIERVGMSRRHRSRRLPAKSTG